MSAVICAGALLLGTFVSSVAQVFLKKAAQKEYKSVVQEYLNPVVILSYAVFFGGAEIGNRRHPVPNARFFLIDLRSGEKDQFRSFV